MPLMSRVADQIDGATRRVPQVMAQALGKARNKVATRSARNPYGPCPVDQLAVLDPLVVSRYCLRESALLAGQQFYGAAMTGIKSCP